MLLVKEPEKTDYESIPIDPYWNVGDETELKMHRIHTYPAKFPSFITTKALEYAEDNNIKTNVIADVFCGCGTVAYESIRNNKEFWGCDINPVATMIAKAKSRKYQKARLEKYFSDIMLNFNTQKVYKKEYHEANGRLQYWYDYKEFKTLLRLKNAIDQVVPQNSAYRIFFVCAFSNILKASSKWLTKSIKPQIDPEKRPADPIDSFKSQYEFMLVANEESDLSNDICANIMTGSFLDDKIERPKVDMVVTSPPYVTSYEYADLHQLSSLWLDYTDDFRKLRQGTIGSLYHECNFNKDFKKLNNIGLKIVSRMYLEDKAKARSIAKYFLDMQKTIKCINAMLRKGGIALFVIGNTEYKGIRIDNAKHLTESLMKSGFSDIKITKRKISKKYLTPYRDAFGRFTRNSQGRKIYSEEFILIGRK